jgi:hypothetical protein
MSHSNDALRRHGIIPPKETKPPSPSPPPSPSLEELLEDFTPSELRELGQDSHDDETERMIERLRRQRIAELQKEEKSRFGRVYPIGRDDYTREVTEASKIDIEGDQGKGTGVVCFLYKDGRVLLLVSHQAVLMVFSAFLAVIKHSNKSEFWPLDIHERSSFPSLGINVFQTCPTSGNRCSSFIEMEKFKIKLPLGVLIASAG